ncbi:MAG: metal ABC transporter substrate-binding protein [Candidatus Eisenbacteria bacterium]|nr:metal ABC transporter substrate-binding protein [Candidatus Eisenbacteria bacterium]
MKTTFMAGIQIIAMSLVVVMFTAGHAGVAGAAIKIVASTNDLASIAAYVGGDRVEAGSICRATSDPHRVEVLPSYMVRVAKADLYLKIGLGLDQWADAIIDGSHNGRLTVVDCSAGVPVLEKPTGMVDASMGDIHLNGNPHYWLNPANGAVAAKTVARALGQLDPAGASGFEARALDFEKAAAEMSVRCATAGRSLPGHAIITYHRSWSYFADACGVEVVSTIEPVPGIPPTGRHLKELVDAIRERKVALVLSEPYFSDDAVKFLARETGVRVVVASPACGTASADSYLNHFEELIRLLEGGRP